VVQVRELMFGTRESFDYRRCASCHSLTLVDIPAGLGRYYPLAYYSNETRQAVQQDTTWRRMAIRSLIGPKLFHKGGRLRPLARRLATIPPELREVRELVGDAGLTSFDDGILDVGCGPKPVRLAILRKVGFKHLMGVEPFMADDTRYQGVPVRKGYLADIAGTYRLIMFNHSLEHVIDPLETLVQARQRLSSNGAILVRTPIADGYLWREYGTNWVELDAPRHTVVFSLPGLDRLAARAGLEIWRTSWESGHWEFIASEQYRRDVAMYEPTSWFEDEAGGGFDEADLARFRALARQLNETGDAGRAAVWLRRTGASPGA
jgi:hypothetical protein